MENRTNCQVDHTSEKKKNANGLERWLRVSIFMKTDYTKCSNFSGIMVLNITYKNYNTKTKKIVRNKNGAL